jgi:hypothetical protein
MTSGAPTEIEELSGRVLGIIGAYEMGAALDARDLDPKNTPAALPPEPALVPDFRGTRDGRYRLAP